MDSLAASSKATDRQFAALLDSEYSYERPYRGALFLATVLSIHSDELIVDLGTKRDGFVPARDLQTVDPAYLDQLQVGDRVPVRVLDASDTRSEVLVSLKQGLAQRDWIRAQELLDGNEACEVEVTGVNRGGVVVAFGRVRGFVPNSHLASVRHGMRGDRLDETKAALVGQTLLVAVIEVDARRRRLVLSERKANRQRRERLLAELNEGQILTGTVCNLVSYGAFVDLGGADGLIHISEMDWRRVDHPSDVLSVGDRVDVYVLSVDRERGRIGLSRKRLLPDPWDDVAEDVQPGLIVEGMVTRLVSFGAFVDVGNGVEGLIHVSEMPAGEESRRALREGDRVEVYVLRLDPIKRRIGLRLREVLSVPTAIAAESVSGADA